MALRQFAVLRNAGSYVIRPKSSGDVLIFRKSIARIVPSVTGTSYVLPVRLSVIVSVSAIERTSNAKRETKKRALRFSFIVVSYIGFHGCFPGNPVRFVGPSCEVLYLAAL